MHLTLQLNQGRFILACQLNQNPKKLRSPHVQGLDDRPLGAANRTPCGAVWLLQYVCETVDAHVKFSLKSQGSRSSDDNSDATKFRQITGTYWVAVQELKVNYVSYYSNKGTVLFAICPQYGNRA